MINHALTLLMNSHSSLVPGPDPTEPRYTRRVLSGQLEAAHTWLIGSTAEKQLTRLVRARFALARLHAVPEVEDYIVGLDGRITYVPFRTLDHVETDPVPAFVAWVQERNPVELINGLPDFAKRMWLYGATNVERDAAAVLSLVLALEKA